MANKALEQIKELLKLANEMYIENPSLAHRYAHLAVRTGTKNQISIPKPEKYFICKSCHHYLFPGRNMRKRIRQGVIVVTCLDCKQIRRYKVK